MTGTSDIRFIGGRYVVEFTAEATRAAHGLEWTEFQRVQAALYELASQQGWVDTGRFGVDGSGHGSANVLQVGECALRFEVEAERNLLRVTALARRR